MESRVQEEKDSLGTGATAFGSEDGSDDLSFCWVQCDVCQQWRSLPGCTPAEYARVQALQRWTCSMNVWDASQARCAGSEVKASPSHGVAVERRMSRTVGPRKLSRTRGSSPHEMSARSQGVVNRKDGALAGESKTGVLLTPKRSGRERQRVGFGASGRRMRSSGPTSGSSVTSAIVEPASGATGGSLRGRRFVPVLREGERLPAGTRDDGIGVRRKRMSGSEEGSEEGPRTLMGEAIPFISEQDSAALPDVHLWPSVHTGLLAATRVEPIECAVKQRADTAAGLEEPETEEGASDTGDGGRARRSKKRKSYELFAQPVIGSQSSSTAVVTNVPVEEIKYGTASDGELSARHSEKICAGLSILRRSRRYSLIGGRVTASSDLHKSWISNRSNCSLLTKGCDHHQYNRATSSPSFSGFASLKSGTAMSSRGVLGNKQHTNRSRSQSETSVEAMPEGERDEEQEEKRELSLRTEEGSNRKVVGSPVLAKEGGPSGADTEGGSGPSKRLRGAAVFSIASEERGRDGIGEEAESGVSQPSETGTHFLDGGNDGIPGAEDAHYVAPVSAYEPAVRSTVILDVKSGAGQRTSDSAGIQGTTLFSHGGLDGIFAAPSRLKHPEGEVENISLRPTVGAMTMGASLTGSGGTPKRGKQQHQLQYQLTSSQRGPSEGGALRWAQCDLCEKWRRLPGCSEEEYAALNHSDAPWHCTLNRWDKARATCAAPEECTLPDVVVSADAISAFSQMVDNGLAEVFKIWRDRGWAPVESEGLDGGAFHEPSTPQARAQQDFPLKGFPWHELPPRCLLQIDRLLVVYETALLHPEAAIQSQWTRVGAKRFGDLQKRLTRKASSTGDDTADQVLHQVFRFLLHKDTECLTHLARFLRGCVKILQQQQRAAAQGVTTQVDGEGVAKELAETEVNDTTSFLDILMPVAKTNDSGTTKQKRRRSNATGTPRQGLETLRALFDAATRYTELAESRRWSNGGFNAIFDVLRLFIGLHGGPLPTPRKSEGGSDSDAALGTGKKVEPEASKSFFSDVVPHIWDARFSSTLISALERCGRMDIVTTLRSAERRTDAHVNVTVLDASPPILRLHPLKGRVVLCGNVPHIRASEFFPGLVSLRTAQPFSCAQSRGGRSVSGGTPTSGGSCAASSYSEISEAFGVWPLRKQVMGNSSATTGSSSSSLSYVAPVNCKPAMGLIGDQNSGSGPFVAGDTTEVHAPPAALVDPAILPSCLVTPQASVASGSSSGGQDSVFSIALAAAVPWLGANASDFREEDKDVEDDNEMLETWSENDSNADCRVQGDLETSASWATALGPEAAERVASLRHRLHSVMKKLFPSTQYVSFSAPGSVTDEREKTEAFSDYQESFSPVDSVHDVGFVHDWCTHHLRTSGVRTGAGRVLHGVSLPTFLNGAKKKKKKLRGESPILDDQTPHTSAARRWLRSETKQRPSSGSRRVIHFVEQSEGASSAASAPTPRSDRSERTKISDTEVSRDGTNGAEMRGVGGNSVDVCVVSPRLGEENFSGTQSSRVVPADGTRGSGSRRYQVSLSSPELVASVPSPPPSHMTVLNGPLFRWQKEVLCQHGLRKGYQQRIGQLKKGVKRSGSTGASSGGISEPVCGTFEAEPAVTERGFLGALDTLETGSDARLKRQLRLGQTEDSEMENGVRPATGSGCRRRVLRSNESVAKLHAHSREAATAVTIQTTLNQLIPCDFLVESVLFVLALHRLLRRVVGCFQFFQDVVLIEDGSHLASLFPAVRKCLLEFRTEQPEGTACAESLRDGAGVSGDTAVNATVAVAEDDAVPRAVRRKKFSTLGRKRSQHHQTAVRALSESCTEKDVKRDFKTADTDMVKMETLATESDTEEEKASGGITAVLAAGDVTVKFSNNNRHTLQGEPMEEFSEASSVRNGSHVETPLDEATGKEDHVRTLRSDPLKTDEMSNKIQDRDSEIRNGRASTAGSDCDSALRWLQHDEEIEKEDNLVVSQESDLFPAPLKLMETTDIEMAEENTLTIDGENNQGSSKEKVLQMISVLESAECVDSAKVEEQEGLEIVEDFKDPEAAPSITRPCPVFEHGDNVDPMHFDTVSSDAARKPDRVRKSSGDGDNNNGDVDYAMGDE